MKIGIITVYDAVTNIGSYLQAFSLKSVLEQLGHEVVFIEKEPYRKVIARCALQLNPKRSFFLRLKRCINYKTVLNEIRILPQDALYSSGIDLLIYGSDEIWNMDNPYFKDPFFFGTNISQIPKVAYAISMGEMNEATLLKNSDIALGIRSFKSIFARDSHTKTLVQSFTGQFSDIVCDPTLLVAKEKFTSQCKLPKQKYLLVYSYGVDDLLQQRITTYAKAHGLSIISAFFWHHWCDQTISCSAFEFDYLIENAECIFTSTFHGAIITMLNHKKCCIYPTRNKVADVVCRFGVGEKLIESTISQEKFDAVMGSDFPTDEFEKKLQKERAHSLEQLKGALACYTD